MKLLQRLLQQTCSHRFGWPRVDAFGRHYQICLDCGTAYEYDWDGMRQTGRLKPLSTIAAGTDMANGPAGWSCK